jgi:hypothetical protein
MDMFFEWTETRHSNILNYPLLIPSDKCIQYMHEARWDVFYIQFYLLIFGFVVLSCLSMICTMQKITELERKIEIMEEVSHVKLV